MKLIIHQPPRWRLLFGNDHKKLMQEVTNHQPSYRQLLHVGVQ
jgi:hypothetical protein